MTSIHGKACAGRTVRACPWGAVRPRFASRGSLWGEPVSELRELCRVALEAAREGEALESFAEESRHTEVRARSGEVEGLTFSEQRGVGVRVIADGRVGFAWASDPSVAEVREIVNKARENS